MEEIEITPKREKAWLAAAYAATGASGAFWWSVKDEKTSVGSVFVDDGSGRLVGSESINPTYATATALFAASAVALVCIKIRIWWMHY